MLDTKFFKDEMAKVDFPISILPINDIPLEMGQKLVRTDTSEPLGIVKSKYKPILHKDCFGGAIEQMKIAGVSFKDAEMKIQSYENGAMAKMELLLPDHHAIIGKHTLSLKYVVKFAVPLPGAVAGCISIVPFPITELGLVSNNTV